MTSKEKPETTISGPINIVRLEGEVFGINKVLYVFFDVHYSCTEETICENIFSDNITTYLINQFRKTKEKYLDFFLETFPSKLYWGSKSIYRGIYITELRKLLTQAFSYDPQQGTVFPSKVFPNVRLHYIDVRDYLFDTILIMQIDNVYYGFRRIYVDLIMSGISKNDIVQFKEQLDNYAKNIKEIYDLFFEQKGGKMGADEKKKRIIKYIDEELSEEERRENILRLIKKIKEKYSHPKIKEIILLMLDKFLKTGLLEILDKIDKINKLSENLLKLFEFRSLHTKIMYDEFTKIPEFVQMGMPMYGPNVDDVTKIVGDIFFLVDSMREISKSSSAVIVDTYFLRRFLDKDYITNGISYTGGAHSVMYIYILTKYFDFKVTHASYSKYNINELNDVIKKTALGRDFGTLFYQPKQMYQCSDITDFPEGFS